MTIDLKRKANNCLVKPLNETSAEDFERGTSILEAEKLLRNN
jgi:hypothetical protein